MHHTLKKKEIMLKKITFCDCRLIIVHTCMNKTDMFLHIYILKIH